MFVKSALLSVIVFIVMDLGTLAAASSNTPVDPATPGLVQPKPSTANTLSSADYPIDALMNGEEGDVTLKLVIREDGSADDVQIVGSSGHLLLDAAAIDIVKRRFHYTPATLNGKPIAVNWKTHVIWHVRDAYDPGQTQNTSTLLTNVFDMGAADYPPESLQNHEQGTTVLVLFVSETGAIISSTVLHSSGSQRLDQAAMSLASGGRWKFKPAMLSGRAMKTVLMIALNWQLPVSSSFAP